MRAPVIRFCAMFSVSAPADLAAPPYLVSKAWSHRGRPLPPRRLEAMLDNCAGRRLGNSLSDGDRKE